MAKVKAQKMGSGIPQKHLHSRLAYLNQAATYLAFGEKTSEKPLLSAKDAVYQNNRSPTQKSSWPICSRSRNLLSQLRAVSLKSQIRLAPDLKRSFCRRCDSPLIPGKTSEESITNCSWYGEKPWADVLVVTCGFCGAVRRFPLGQKLGQEKVNNSVEAQ